MFNFNLLLFLGSYRLLARHLGNAENSQNLNYTQWSNFSKRHPWGKFLSRGACKDVFCVRDTDGVIEAVSTGLGGERTLYLFLSFFILFYSFLFYTLLPSHSSLSLTHKDTHKHAHSLTLTHPLDHSHTSLHPLLSPILTPPTFLSYHPPLSL